MPEMIERISNERRRNLAPWIGLLIGLVAILSNAAFFLNIPGQRAIPFLSWALAVIALVFAAVGVMRAFRQPQIYGGKVSSSVLGVLSLLLFALVVLTSVGARKLPGSAGAPQPGQKAPDFALADTSGNKVSLEGLLGKPNSQHFIVPATSDVHVAANATLAPPLVPKAVLLIFYRGYW
jgi:hypothetical protein